MADTILEPKRKREVTLESLIEKETQLLAKRKETTNSHIQRLQERLQNTSGDEQQRIQSLINLHTNHKSELDSLDPVTIANEKFKKLNNLS